MIYVMVPMKANMGAVLRTLPKQMAMVVKQIRRDEEGEYAAIFVRYSQKFFQCLFGFPFSETESPADHESTAKQIDRTLGPNEMFKVVHGIYGVRRRPYGLLEVKG